jgi:hypothetical protein
MTHRPRITKEEHANCEWFKAEIDRRLVALGAARNRDCEYALATVAGTLRVTVYENWIACRFEEPNRAKAAVSDTRLNPYSGKWNHHYDHAEFKCRRATRLCVDYFFMELDRYLPEVKP